MPDRRYRYSACLAMVSSEVLLSRNRSKGKRKDVLERLKNKVQSGAASLKQ